MSSFVEKEGSLIQLQQKRNQKIHLVRRIVTTKNELTVKGFSPISQRAYAAHAWPIIAGIL